MDRPPAHGKGRPQGRPFFASFGGLAPLRMRRHAGLMASEPARFAALVAQCWSAASASTYSADNPSCGQCSVTALVAQDWLGGDVAKTPAGGDWHWYNMIDGQRFDFTADQFAARLDYRDAPSTRADALTDTSVEQYRALSDAVRALAQGSGRK